MGYSLAVCERAAIAERAALATKACPTRDREAVPEQIVTGDNQKAAEAAEAIQPQKKFTTKKPLAKIQK